MEIKNFQKWHESKRKGSLIFYGEIKVKFSDNLYLLIRSTKNFEEWTVKLLKKEINGLYWKERMLFSKNKIEN